MQKVAMYIATRITKMSVTRTKPPSFESIVDEAYRTTMAQFKVWSKSDAFPNYVKFVVPKSTSPKPGFAIFYTPPKPSPRLLIIGQNPSNFAGRGADLAAEPNVTMLSGKPPTMHSYIGHSHVFANEMRAVFGGHEKLLEQAVGMNLWHFQAVEKAASAPKPIRDFCEETTRTLVAAMKPSTILCYGAPAFDAITKGLSVDHLTGHGDIRTATLGKSKIFGVPHLTGSYTRVAAGICAPIAIDAIAKHLAAKRK